MAVTNQARSCVNTIITAYDQCCHKDVPNITDIFNPRLERGLKETSLEFYAEKLKGSGLDFDYAKLEAEIVENYKESAPTLSFLFALAGILDSAIQDADQKKAQFLNSARAKIIEALAQDHLRNKKSYPLDPMGRVWLMIQSSMAVIKGQAKPLPQFANGKRHFFAQIFQEVFIYCDLDSKKKIIQQLNHFEPVLNTRSARLQRIVFKVEGALNYHLTNRYVKFGVSIAFGFACYHAVYKMIALAGKVFASAAFNSIVISRMPVFVVQILSGAYTRMMQAMAYVATTRPYGLLFNSGKIVPYIVCSLVPMMGWIYAPVFAFSEHMRAIFYERLFGPDARTQVAIVENLETYKEKHELLDGGMKVYQVWMYLMERGPQEGMFK
ncbi:MAG TPA: hypothetical protein VFU89_00550 [Rhabdochlamydiaceae bacterium]|nr:hypothetical protein [Rhabdochlamydiaceae bacterium]